ncbi:MAG: efflux RND transporter permease subunit, partial [Alphaproteobacteria bacterium]
GIDKVDLVGARDEEIWVEVPPDKLRQLDLTLAEVAARIAATSQDIPSGDVRGGAEKQIRSLGLLREAEGLAGVEVRALETGQKVYLSDIATVREAFEDGAPTVRRLGEPAVELHIQRALDADALDLADTVDAYLNELLPTLPPELRVEQHMIAADLIRDRIGVLRDNGLFGLVLVVAILFLFLNLRVAFWVAAAIPVAMLATMAVLLVSGQTMNMVTLFGLIMVIGVVVDDAIVVGEHAEARRRAGLPALEAAEAGARRMAAPVVSASLTTIAAFLPLFFISDLIGRIIVAIPYAVVAVIVASLLECFLVLPGHLRGALAGDAVEPMRLTRRFNAAFERFRDGPFRRFVALAIHWRYVTTACAAAALIVSLGLVAGGRVGFFFFPTPESDWIYANVRMVPGTPRAEMAAMLDELERALDAAEERLTDGARGVVKVAVAKLGTTVDRPMLQRQGDHLGGVVAELVGADERDIRTDDLVTVWREQVREAPGVESLTIVPAQGGPPGREIDLRLSGAEPSALKAAAGEVRGLLVRYPGVSDVADDLPYGKAEAILELTPRGRALGFTTESVGRQVRHAFEGAIAKRFARGDEEVAVRVRFPRDAAHEASLRDLYLRGPDGAEVALSEVVDVREKVGFARIKREDGVRQVAVTAEVDERVTSSDEVLAALLRDGLYDVAASHGVEVSFAGKAEEQAQTFGDMKDGAVLALAAIYIILAWVFASYTRPLVVMAVIPLGVVGAVLGHLLLGYDLTILSMVALLGLSGIVVNDSIILVSAIEGRLKRGEPLHQAIVEGSRDRLRAVILTSATTIGGLTPLLFETSLQAQFLIPMALTIVFGLMVTTVLVLVVVPALLVIEDDFAGLIRA